MKPIDTRFSRLIDDAHKGKLEHCHTELLANSEHLASYRVSWARLNGIRDKTSEGVRTFAAMVLAHSDNSLEHADLDHLTATMMNEKNQEVCNWLACALHKRRHRRLEVWDAMRNALSSQTPAGDFARSLKLPLPVLD